MLDVSKIPSFFDIIHEFEYICASDIARILYRIFKNEFQYVCSIWHSYNQHLGRWEQTYDGGILQEKMSTVLLPALYKCLDKEKTIYESYIYKDVDPLTNSWPEEPSSTKECAYLKRYNSIAKLILRLGETDFKLKVMNACEKLFWADSI